jgi:hypothetical protein
MENSTEATGIKLFTQPYMTSSTQLKTRMEWSRLLTSSAGTKATPLGNTQADPVSSEIRGSAHQIMKDSNDEGGTTPGFDLGSEGEREGEERGMCLLRGRCFP